MLRFIAWRRRAGSTRRGRARWGWGASVGLLIAGAPALAQLPTLPTTTLTVPTTLVTVPTTVVTIPTTLVTVPTTTLTVPTTTPTVTVPPTTLPSTTLPPTTLPPTTLPGATTTTLTVTTTTLTTPTRPAPTCAAGCDDGNACTADRCELALCVNEPLTGATCDDGDACSRGDRCTLGLCAATEVGCVTSRACRRPCTDDEFACTDEVCTAGECLAVPVDSRCVPPGQCTAAVCVAATGGGDAAGCLVGPALPDGERCAEDTDACTEDVCRGGVCTHARAVDATDCAPVQGAFRATIALGALARTLVTDVTAAAPDAAATLVPPLTAARGDLEAAERALAGQDAGAVVVHVAVPVQ
ncbi:MAG TPA: hypothetical protein VKA21_03225, partial [Candidatus Binatia bacterium]|nr:hypothetical protein [Candidatus Binatia bacterium]